MNSSDVGEVEDLSDPELTHNADRATISTYKTSMMFGFICRTELHFVSHTNREKYSGLIKRPMLFKFLLKFGLKTLKRSSTHSARNPFITTSENADCFESFPP